MPATLRGVDPDCLERSCTTQPNSIRFGTGAAGVERAEVHLSTCAFELHRHDTYALGVTTAGVQTFHYRGTRRFCLPGQLHVLHPDEAHDGAAGTAEGFRYRILYIEPALIREAIDGAELPFVADPVQDPTPATCLVASLLDDIDQPIGELRRVEIATIVADTLRSLGGRPDTGGSIDLAAATLVRDYLAAHPSDHIRAATLERLAGIDRFSIARHFRRAFGTSPDRYRTMRRLDLARTAIRGGLPLAAAAAQAGFADQSHMTRQFKHAYGLTPARWARATVNGISSPPPAGDQNRIDGRYAPAGSL
jgi:AraC-like DNA-binding protein